MTTPDRVPPPIRKLLTWDVRLTKSIVDYAYTHYPKLSEQSTRSFMKLLEISCHGIPWISIALISIYLNITSREISVNLLLALIYDIIIVGLVKALTRRTRPIPGDAPPLSAPIDKFSFPSGHATRSVLLTLLFSYTTGSLILTLIISAWTSIICASRILMRRHHVLDVLCGVGIGVLEWGLVAFLWAGEDASRWVASYIASAEDEFDGS